MSLNQSFISSKTVAEKGVTYLSLTRSHNPEGRFSYDSAEMCKKKAKRGGVKFT